MHLNECLFYLFIPQIPERKQLSVPKIESPEGYYEEAEPYDTSLNGTSWEQAWEGADHFLHRCRRQLPLW